MLFAPCAAVVALIGHICRWVQYKSYLPAVKEPSIRCIDLFEDH